MTGRLRTWVTGTERDTQRMFEARLAAGGVMMEDPAITRTKSEQARHAHKTMLRPHGGGKLQWPLSKHDMNAAGWAVPCTKSKSS